MEDVEFSAEFCRFIQTTIPDMAAAELLIIFQSRPEARMTVEEVMTRLGPGVALAEVEKYLESFEARGLIARRDGRYQYVPEALLNDLVKRLAQAYTQRPVTLVRIIYALRDSSIQSFADAFRLRKR